jgi:rhodanese-related sulfurtransferase
MRWKQFFTPVSSINAADAKKLVADTPLEDLTILDVRQPKEYQRSHLPGAILMPLPQLAARMSELDPQKPVMVY